MNKLPNTARKQCEEWGISERMLEFCQYHLLSIVVDKDGSYITFQERFHGWEITHSIGSPRLYRHCKVITHSIPAKNLTITFYTEGYRKTYESLLGELKMIVENRDITDYDKEVLLGMLKMTRNTLRHYVFIMIVMGVLAGLMTVLQILRFLP
jgi:hypothetical protein